MNYAIDGFKKLAARFNYPSPLLKILDLPLVGIDTKRNEYLSYDRVPPSYLFSLGAREVNEQILLNSLALGDNVNTKKKMLLAQEVKKTIIALKKDIDELEKEKAKLLNSKISLEYLLLNVNDNDSLIDFLRKCDTML